MLLLVLLEVTPERGGASFIEQEAVLVRAQNVERLTPGYVIRVRYNEPKRTHVYPVSPIEVVGRVE